MSNAPDLVHAPTDIACEGSKDVPTLLRGFRERLGALGGSGIMNPFETLPIAFHHSALRHFGCREMADSAAMVSAYVKTGQAVAAGFGGLWLLLPSWIPSPAFIRRSIAGVRLFFAIRSVVRQRQQDDRREDDTLQFLLDSGDDVPKILVFMASVAFATQNGPSYVGPATLCFLGANPEWQEKVRAEVLAATDRKTPNGIQDALETLSLSDWETRFPLTCACIHETIRISLSSVFSRYHFGPDDLRMGEHTLRQATTVVRALLSISPSPAP